MKRSAPINASIPFPEDGGGLRQRTFPPGFDSSKNTTGTAAGGLDLFEGRGRCVGSRSSCAPCSGHAESKWEDENEANKKIVKELNSLTIQQREHLFDTIHGVAEPTEETEEFIQKKLEGIQKSIDWLRKKEAYDLAHFLSPEFVKDRELRLRALRISNYDEPLAAKRLISHFDFKLKLYGVDNIVKPISYDILSPSMVRLLRSGYVQVMPYKDRTNRTIIFDSVLQPVDDWRSHYGFMMYILYKAMCDVEVQKKGVSIIIHSIGMNKPSDQSFSLAQKSNQFESSNLTNAGVMHFCYDDARFRPLLYALQSVMRERLRFRATYGSHTECTYQLMSFGIMPFMLPLDDEGKVDTERGNRRIDEWVKEEREEDSRKRQVIIPTSRCVVIGKGHGFVYFVGNRFLAELAERNRSDYANLKRSDKSNLSRAIVEYIVNVRGGSFLKRSPTDDDGKWEWIPATDREANDKVAQIFRKPRRADVDTRHQSVVYRFGDGRTILVPPQARLSEWEKIVLPD